MDPSVFCAPIIEAYFKYYPINEHIPVKIILTDNLGQTHCELRPDRREELEKMGDANNDYNGRMVVPHELDGTIHVLLNSQKIVEYTNDQSMTWIGTLAHELTHAIDYYQMARKELLESYDPLEEISLYSMFQLWSEYHARKIGYSFLRKMLSVDVDPSKLDQQIAYINNKEWPFHRKRHYEEYHHTANGYQQMYITMQLLGRYSVWCDIYPQAFNESNLTMDFANVPWMFHLFSFLYHHESLDVIYNHFEDMRLILQENWPTV